jgi:vacuolar-type H+-ATPase subunit E/Vma4
MEQSRSADPGYEDEATPIFGAYRRGYDPEQVDRYVNEQQRRLDAALHRASEAERKLAAAVGQLRELHRRVAHLENEERSPRAPGLDALGERVQRVLQEAWEGAYALRQEAETEVAELREQALEEVTELRARVTSEVAELAARSTAEIEDLRRSAEEEARSRRAHAEQESHRLLEAASNDARRIRQESERFRDAVRDRSRDERQQAVAQITRLYDQRQMALAELGRLQATVEATVEEMAKSPIGIPPEQRIEDIEGIESLFFSDDLVEAIPTPERGDLYRPRGSGALFDGEPDGATEPPWGDSVQAASAAVVSSPTAQAIVDSGPVSRDSIPETGADEPAPVGEPADHFSPRGHPISRDAGEAAAAKPEMADAPEIAGPAGDGPVIVGQRAGSRTARPAVMAGDSDAVTAPGGERGERSVAPGVVVVPSHRRRQPSPVEPREATVAESDQGGVLSPSLEAESSASVVAGGETAQNEESGVRETTRVVVGIPTETELAQAELDTAPVEVVAGDGDADPIAPPARKRRTRRQPKSSVPGGEPQPKVFDFEAE